MIKLKLFAIGTITIIFIIGILIFTIQNSSVDKSDYLHYSEFNGKIVVENQCSKNMMCFGYYDNGTKIPLECSDMVVHGCSDNQDFDDYQFFK